ncbi:hypothetical protein [Sphingobacterium rhinopitheci]|uniref:hypothetical protein n=1 Tax=Sphingobacterium rhinopitheci TaxID=2781960 RepID=UPI001F5197C5|nr:hypothetical protein [Sphingobacterium rhinopitheci]MCI0920525.1 hypothetical protein [Sphingobacterium rhinopitheci]
MKKSYTINTLHRGKYMLSFFVLLFAMGGLSSLIPAEEIVKIVFVLFTIPLILYISVKASQRPSNWSVDDQELVIQFGDKTIVYPIAEIDHIRTLTRSGGTLYVIYRKKKSTARYWRNKLFQSQDDQIALQQEFTASAIEYYKF